MGIKIKGFDKIIRGFQRMEDEVRQAERHGIPVPKGMTPEQATQQWLDDLVKSSL